MDSVGMPDDMWSPFKHIYRVIDQTISSSSAVPITELETFLKRYKHNFVNILRNPPKNERSRAQLRSGLTEGITLPGHGRTMVLSKDLVDESIILSDMYDLDEFVALELLWTAQRQMSQHPGLPRGLVAILLYYDGRRSMAYSLRDMFQVVSGVSWATDASNEVTTSLTTFSKSLVDEHGILEKIITLLEELDIVKENEILTKNRAFGTKKHQNQVLELFEDIKLALATTVFHWSAQRGLPKAIVVRLIKSLAKNKSTEASGNVDDVTFTLWMALIYGYDTSVLQRQEDNSLQVQNLPVMSEPDYAQTVYDSLMMEYTGAEGQNNLLVTAKFAFALSLASLRHAPTNIQNSLSKVIDQDEQLMDDAISKKNFEIFYHHILEKDIIYKTQFFYLRIHMLFTDFIDFMHSKVTELRGRADETARTIMTFVNEGLEPPNNLDHSFEMLMLSIGKLYKDNRAGLSLCVDYWGPLDVSATSTKATTRSVSLFKFIRLAGELLPPTLLVPYLRMIAGLTSCERSARSAFNLLKQASGLAGSATLSWEHFFTSLMRYYTSMRQEHSATYDTIYRNRMFNRNISPQELEGLHAVLGVIKSVATYDEIARIAMCEHPNWTPLHVLLGLLSCAVPLSMKAQLLETLSALCKSKETAVSLWHNLETSQIIATIPTTSTYNACHLEVEIEQNECRDETYPLSRGILDLLYSLIKTVVPKNLGSGPRKPGLDPYFTFIINDIFLKFYNRTYKNPAEKWEVGEKCLKLLHHMLQTYEVNSQDFDPNNEQNPHPGFHVMLQLNTKSEMLRLILLIIDDVRSRLDEYSKFYGKKTLESCAFYCLNILDMGLTKQDIFFEAHSYANCATLLSGLNKLLLDVNPRSRKPDHILNTTKFITYSSWLPEHSLVAVKILNKMTTLPNMTTQILSMFTQNERVQNEIRQGFVECLETELKVSPFNIEEDLNSSDNVVRVEVQIKEAVIELLQNCLQQPPPNLSHYLLGFDSQRDILLSCKQRLNAIDTPSNCTKSLIYILDNHLEAMRATDIYDIDIERIVEHSYKLLYSLCSNSRTSDVIFRFLRFCNDFIHRHVSALPFTNANRSYVLNQMSYLLKCVAIELKITASNSQISRFQHLCDITIGISGGNSHDSLTLELNNLYSHSSHLYAEATTAKNPSEKSSNIMLCNLLDFIIFDDAPLPAPVWEFFDVTLIKQIVKDCEMKSAQGHKLVNLKKMHEIMHEELRTVQSTIASGQRKLILREIEAMLLYALQINEQRSKNYATIKLMEAWCQVTEVLYTCAPDAALSVANRLVLILETLQRLLSKIVPNHTNNELSILASETVLLLLVDLRFLYKEILANDSNNKILFVGVDAEPDKINLPTSAKTNALSLEFILKNLLEWLIVSGVGSQKLRGNLYSALLNVLRIVKSTEAFGGNESYSEYVYRLDRSYDAVGTVDVKESHTQYTRMTLEAFVFFGEKLIDLICNACISGHDIVKMSALSCIDALLDLDLVAGFINFMGSHGYLTVIIDSLFQSDEGLCLALCLVPENMRTLYVYETQMVALMRIANSQIGAEMLLVEKILTTLSNMRVFDMHPDFHNHTANRSEEGSDFIPPIDVRFRQVLLPAINLCDCIVATLGPENHSAISQITNFMLSHSEMFEVVLRNATPFLELGLLSELSAITGLIARTTNQHIFDSEDWCLNQDTQVKLHRIQRFMLSIFSRFTVCEATFKDMFKTENMRYEVTEANKTLHIKYFLEIASNLALYCRNAIADHSIDHLSNTILFTPSLTQQSAKLPRDAHGNSMQKTLPFNELLNQLKGSVEYFNTQKTITDNLLRQRGALSNLSLDSSAKSTYAELTQRYNVKQNEQTNCAFIAEQCLYLLWNHLDFFMRRALSTTAANRNLISNDGTHNLYGSSKDEISILKTELISLLNETFCNQLLETTVSKSGVARGFNEALLRRIKALIQFVPVN